ncbi:hypothetical protein NDU88_007505 [Pleurodeles waltl]|uniref:Uncharacterized protein n=1 Tax=Pleurodeles waltl TaxID=8319 RepID=A0AAV7M331_PLEWA|nr:hypothetical protein NDU88_007505 [Pleurodeles waltl]
MSCTDGITAQSVQMEAKQVMTAPGACNYRPIRGRGGKGPCGAAGPGPRGPSLAWKRRPGSHEARGGAANDPLQTVHTLTDVEGREGGGGLRGSRTGAKGAQPGHEARGEASNDPLQTVHTLTGVDRREGALRGQQDRGQGGPAWPGDADQGATRRGAEQPTTHCKQSTH